tara:strand:+ start:325 stop:543 length:219 start_codon:yes stop_codon:yes gene_type:complete
MKVGDLVRFKDVGTHNSTPVATWPAMFPELDGKTGLVLAQGISISGCRLATVMLMGEKETFNESFFEVINHA